MERRKRPWLRFLCLAIIAYIGMTTLVFSVRFTISYLACGHMLAQPGDDGCLQEPPHSR